MVSFRNKLASSLRSLRKPSGWKWLEKAEKLVDKVIDKIGYFPPMHDCGDFVKFNGPEYWKKNPKPDKLPTRLPTKKTKTAALAELFFPREARRIENIRKVKGTEKNIEEIEKRLAEAKAKAKAQRE